MQQFNMGALVDWYEVGMGELIAFEVPSNGYRAVSFDIMADRFVSVMAIGSERAVLVGCGEGRFDVAFSAGENVAISVQGDPLSVVYLRTRIETQTVPQSQEGSFTTVEPRVAGPSDEVRRLMHIMAINGRQREAQIAEGYELRLAEALSAVRPEVEPEPVLLEAFDVKA